VVRTLIEAVNQNDELVLSMIGMSILGRRQPGS
jgi:hypothetical protein